MTDLHTPGAKDDAGKPKIYERMCLMWPLICQDYIHLVSYHEIDRFFSGLPPQELAKYFDLGTALLISGVALYGAEKYTVDGWMEVPNGAVRYREAAARHYSAELDGIYKDDESGLPHMSHARWNVLAWRWFEAKQ